MFCDYATSRQQQKQLALTAAAATGGGMDHTQHAHAADRTFTVNSCLLTLLLALKAGERRQQTVDRHY